MKIYKVKVVQKYRDLERNELMKPGTIIEVTEERAKKLESLHLVLIQGIVSDAIKLTPKEAEKILYHTVDELKEAGLVEAKISATIKGKAKPRKRTAKKK